MVWMKMLTLILILKQYPLNPYQRHQIEEKRHIFMEGYFSRNANSFYSRELLVQHNISALMVDMSEMTE
jgi:hypothetical protein